MHMTFSSSQPVIFRFHCRWNEYLVANLDSLRRIHSIGDTRNVNGRWKKALCWKSIGINNEVTLTSGVLMPLDYG